MQPCMLSLSLPLGSGWHSPWGCQTGKETGLGNAFTRWAPGYNTVDLGAASWKECTRFLLSTAVKK